MCRTEAIAVERQGMAWAAGVEQAVIERVEFDENEQVIVVRVRPGRRGRAGAGWA